MKDENKCDERHKRNQTLLPSEDLGGNKLQARAKIRGSDDKDRFRYEKFQSPRVLA